jgi:hypothetical protein
MHSFVFASEIEEMCDFDNQSYNESSQIQLRGNHLTCKLKELNIFKDVVKNDNSKKYTNKIVIGSEFCILNNTPYFEGSQIRDDRFILECIIIGYDYDSNAIFSFEIPGAKKSHFNNQELLEMGVIK